MKKFTALLLTLVLCLSRVACGSSGPDKQPAIDSYNTLAENYNAFVDIANKDLSAWGEEDIEFMNNCADVINEYGTKLDSDEELTQEEIDEAINWLKDTQMLTKQYQETEIYFS